MNLQLTKNGIGIRHILYGNAIFSGVSGFFFSIAARQISAFLGLDAQGTIFALAWVMIGYALLLYFNAARPAIAPGFVLFTAIADSTWVLLSFLLLVTGWVSFSEAGKWTIGITALMVDAFATLQFLAWRKMNR